MSVEKFADLAPTIQSAMNKDSVYPSAKYALEWLDRHPEEIPKKTITRDELSRVIDDASGSNLSEVIRSVVEEIGVEVVEPTNREKWKKFCEGLGINLEPWQVDYLSRHMDEAGVIAP